MGNAEPVYDLFISYADADRAWVEGYLLDALAQAGVRYHSEAAFALGVPRLLEFGRAVQQSRRTLLVLSPAYLAEGFSQFTDLLAQSYGLETATWPVIPLILQPVKLPPRLAILIALDATAPASWPGVIERLCAALQRPVPGPASRPPCPYPGMVPFSARDARSFYGRDAEIRHMLQHLRHQRYLFVIGPSGCGKSSLISAGLLPQLAQSSYFPQGFWLVREMRPGAQPLQTLAQAIGGDPAQPARTLADLLAAPPARRLLLVIDQFEELFTQAGRAEQSPFIAALQALHMVESCALLIALRADFYPDLMLSDLWPVDPGQRLEIAPLRGEALRRAIQQPAADAGVHLEAGLLERLLADAADEPGVLPLLQETMVLLWDEMQRRLLSLSAYARLGGEGRSGLAVAMATKADASLAGLSPTRQAIARRIFIRLVQFGEGRADTRRQQPVAELRSTNDDPDEFGRTLRHLADNRLLTLSGEEASAGRRADIAHEALISGWPTLSKRVAERREAEQTRRRLEDKAREWVRLGRGRSGLLDEVELLEAERWLAGSDAVDLGYGEALPALVNASRAAVEEAEREKEATRQRELTQAQALAAEQQRRAEEQARAARRFRRLAVALTVVFLLAVGATVFALGKQQRAQDEANARATEVVVRSTAEAKAKENEWLAATRAAEAIAAQETAEARRVETERKNLVSIAQALAAYALHEQVRKQDERSALLARQAYLFNRRSQEPVLDQIDQALRTILGVPYFHIILDRYEAGVNSVAFSPHGRILASGNVDGIVRLWNLYRPDTTPIVLYGHKGRVYSVAFSPNGETLASGGIDGTVRLWDLGQPGATPTILQDHESPVYSVAFSPDGKTLASGSADGAVRLWGLNQHSFTVTVLPAHELGVRSVTFSPDGQMLASGSDDATIRVWHLNQLSDAPIVIPNRGSGVRSVIFSPDGETLASGSTDGIVRLWDLRQSGATATILQDHEHVVNSVAFSPDGKTLASGSADGTVRLWDLDRHSSNPAVLRDHVGIVLSVAFSPDGQMLASASLDGTIQMWDVSQSSANPAVLRGHRWKVNAVAFAPDDQMLASGSSDHTVRLWNLRQPNATPTVLRDYESGVRSVAFSPSGQVLASGSDDGVVRLWDVGRPNPISTVLHDHAAGIWSVAFSPDGRVLASGSDDETIRLWDLGQASAVPIILRGHAGTVLSVAFSPDGQMLASASLDGTVRLWDVSQPRSIPTPAVLRGHEGWVRSVAFSPDGQMLASGGEDKTVLLWDVGQPDPTPTDLLGHESVVNSVAFSPDGQILASSSDDNTVRLWDLRRLSTRPVVLRGHDGGIRSLAFSSDEETLASGGDDGIILLWIARTATLANMVCEKVWRNLTMDEWNLFVGEGIPYERTCPNLPPPEGASPDALPAIH